MKARTLLIIFLSAMILMVSCTKEPDSQKDVYAAKLLDEQLVNKVEKFIQLAKDVKEGKILKSGDKMPIPDAIAYIDESFNYQYVFHMQPFGDIKTVSAEVILPIIPSEEKTYTVDAAAGYNDAVSQIRTKYKELLIGDKELIGIIIENKGLYNSNSIKLLVTAQIGFGFPVLAQSGMDWWWIRDSKSCDGSITGTGAGAPNIIEGEVNAYWRPAVPPNYRIWYTNCQEIKLENPKDYRTANDPLDNYCDYALFYATARLGITDTEKCLSGEDLGTEIDFYKRSVNPILTSLTQTYSLSFKSASFYEATGTDLQFSTIEHHMKINLGVKHLLYIGIESDYPISIDK